MGATAALSVPKLSDRGSINRLGCRCILSKQLTNFIAMKATGYNPLLVFLFSGTLLFSAAIHCNGEPVLDTDGNEIHTGNILGVTYRIQNGAPIGFHGGLAMSSVHNNSCENYIYEAPETFPGESVHFDSDFTGSSVMEVGSRYKFTFHWPSTLGCKKPGQWTVGNVINEGQTSFQPIIAGQEFSSNLQDSWFEVRSTEEERVYKLAACPCEFCRILCPEIGSFRTEDGRTVLGIGGEHYTVKFTTTILAIKTRAEE